jgi:hypothetical protein
VRHDHGIRHPGLGDASLIAAGVLAGEGKLNVGILLVVSAAAWMLDSVIRYAVGHHGDVGLLNSPGWLENRRRNLLAKDDRAFGRHIFIASATLPAFVSGILIRFMLLLGAMAFGACFIGDVRRAVVFPGREGRQAHRGHRRQDSPERACDRRHRTGDQSPDSPGDAQPVRQTGLSNVLPRVVCHNRPICAQPPGLASASTDARNRRSDVALNLKSITLSDWHRRARRDAHTAWAYAVNCVIREDQPLQPRGSVVDSYAIDLLDQLAGDRERLLAAARAACIAPADEVGDPGRWRPAIRAVELCQRAAELIEVKEAGQ